MNFSNKYIVDFDNESFVLTIKKNDSFDDDCFYGENINLSLIVGDNGAGKTTLLNHILQHASGDGAIGYGSSYISVIEKNNGENSCLFVSALFSPEVHKSKNFMINNISELKIQCDSNKMNTSIYPNINTGMNNLFNGIPFLYITDSFNQATGLAFHNQYNLSPYSEMMNERQKNSNDRFANIMTHYFYNSYKRQIHFISKNSDSISSFGISIPKTVTLEILFNYNFEKENGILFSKIVECFTKIGGTTFFYYFAVSIVEHIDNRSFRDNLEALINNKTYLATIFENHLSPLQLINDCLVSSKENMPLYKYWQDLINQINIIGINYNDLLVDSHYSNFRFDISSQKNISIFNDLLDLCEKACPDYPLVQFSWGLSSGEISLLNLFSKLGSFQNELHDGYFLGSNNSCKNNVILLLDEPDVSLHPEWQRKLLLALFQFLSRKFNKTHFHIIMTTHSPLIVSDVLKRDVIFLKPSNDRTIIVDNYVNNTFCSNIYDLYSSSFFLKEFYGEFALHKIKKSCDRLYKLFIYLQQKDSSRNDEILKLYDYFDYDCKIVQNIGEQILKSELMKYVVYIKNYKGPLL